MYQCFYQINTYAKKYRVSCRCVIGFCIIFLLIKIWVRYSEKLVISQGFKVWKPSRTPRLTTLLQLKCTMNFSELFTSIQLYNLHLLFLLFRYSDPQKLCRCTYRGSFLWCWESGGKGVLKAPIDWFGMKGFSFFCHFETVTGLKSIENALFPAKVHWL